MWARPFEMGKKRKRPRPCVARAFVRAQHGACRRKRRTDKTKTPEFVSPRRHQDLGPQRRLLRLLERFISTVGQLGRRISIIGVGRGKQRSSRRKKLRAPEVGRDSGSIFGGDVLSWLPALRIVTKTVYFYILQPKARQTPSAAWPFKNEEGSTRLQL